MEIENITQYIYGLLALLTLRVLITISLSPSIVVLPPIATKLKRDTSIYYQTRAPKAQYTIPVARLSLF